MNVTPQNFEEKVKLFARTLQQRTGKDAIVSVRSSFTDPYGYVIKLSDTRTKGVDEYELSLKQDKGRYFVDFCRIFRV